MNVNAVLSHLKRSCFFGAFLLAALLVFALPQVALAEEPVESSGDIETASVVEVEEGVYVLKSLVASNMVADIDGASTVNGSNIQLYGANQTYAQYWRVEKSGDHYRILNSFTGMALDVEGAGKTSGTNVQLYTANGTSAQLWDFVEAEDGSYYIRSVCNGLMLDVEGAGTSNYTNIQVYAGNATSAQKWKLEKLEKTLDEGIYTVQSAINSSYVLDVDGGLTDNGKALQVYSANNTAAQKWQVLYDEETGFYTVLSVASGKSIDIPGASNQSGVKLHQYASISGSTAQAWRVVQNTDGTYTLHSIINDYVIDVTGASATNGTRVQMYQSNATAAQKWTFEETNAINDGLYQIAASKNESMILDVTGASTSENAALQIYGINGTLAQKWYISREGEGYTIKNANSGLYLTDSGSSLTHGSSVTDASIWTVRVSKAGGLVFTNASTGKVIDLDGGITTSGRKVLPYSSNGTSAQAWLLKSANLVEEGYYVISSRADDDYVLDVTGGSVESQATVQVYESNGTGAQIWEVTSCGGGYYTISNAQSGLPLDVVGGSADPGTEIWQYTANGSDAQKWRFSLADNGGVVITSKLGNVSLTAEMFVNEGDAIIDTTDLSDPDFAWSFTATEYNGEDIDTYWSSSYVDSLRARAQSAGSSTNWSVVTDIDYGRVAVFTRTSSSSKWVLARAIEDVNTAGNTFSGTFTLCHKTRSYWVNGYNINDYFCCYVDDMKSYNDTSNGYGGYQYVSNCLNGVSGYDEGQGFHYGFSSGGCITIESMEDIKYIYDNVSVGSKVINF